MGFKHIYSQANYRIIPTLGKINRLTFEFTNYSVWNSDNSFNERFNQLNYKMEFRTTAALVVVGTQNDVQLLYPISFTGKTPLPVGRYRYSTTCLLYNSGIRKLFNYFFGVAGGVFYNGEVKQIQTGFTVRKQPYLSFTMPFEYNKFHFPINYGETTLFLIARGLK